MDGRSIDSGTLYAPHFWVGCVGTMDLIGMSDGVVQRVADGMAESGLNYTLTLYSTGDVEVACSAELGSASSGTSAEYYPSVVAGAHSGGCTASADYPPLGTTAGYWSFSADGPQAVYKDTDNPLGLNGFVHTFIESECHCYVNNDGPWTQVTLADVF